VGDTVFLFEAKYKNFVMDVLDKTLASEDIKNVSKFSIEITIVAIDWSLFIYFQVTSTRRLRRELFDLRVKLPPASYLFNLLKVEENRYVVSQGHSSTSELAGLISTLSLN